MKKLFLLLSAFLFAFISNAQEPTSLVGTIKVFEDGSKGVVFFDKGDGHGIAVSLDEVEVCWYPAKTKKTMQDISGILNVNSPELVNNPDCGVGNTDAIVAQLGKDGSPAVKWCMSHGDGWYLPCAGGLRFLLAVANKGEGDKGPISIAIEMLGGQGFTSSWYWSSSEMSARHAFDVSRSGSAVSDENKYESVAVRAFRNF